MGLYPGKIKIFKKSKEKTLKIILLARLILVAALKSHVCIVFYFFCCLLTRTPLKDEFLILMRFYPVKITGKKSQEKSPEADRASMLDFSVSARKPKAVSNSKKNGSKRESVSPTNFMVFVNFA